MLYSMAIHHLSSKNYLSIRKLSKNKHILKIKVKNGRN